MVFHFIFKTIHIWLFILFAALNELKRKFEEMTVFRKIIQSCWRGGKEILNACCIRDGNGGLSIWLVDSAAMTGNNDGNPCLPVFFIIVRKQDAFQELNGGY